MKPDLREDITAVIAIAIVNVVKEILGEAEYGGLRGDWMVSVPVRSLQALETLVDSFELVTGEPSA